MDKSESLKTNEAISLELNDDKEASKKDSQLIYNVELE